MADRKISELLNGPRMLKIAELPEKPSQSIMTQDDFGEWFGMIADKYEALEAQLSDAVVALEWYETSQIYEPYRNRSDGHRDNGCPACVLDKGERARTALDRLKGE